MISINKASASLKKKCLTTPKTLFFKGLVSLELKFFRKMFSNKQVFDWNQKKLWKKICEESIFEFSEAEERCRNDETFRTYGVKWVINPKVILWQKLLKDHSCRARWPVMGYQITKFPQMRRSVSHTTCWITFQSVGQLALQIIFSFTLNPLLSFEASALHSLLSQNEQLQRQ